jgi:hypothetical protein
MQFDGFQVYETVVAKNEEFFIAVLPEEFKEEALDLLTKFCIPEENFCKAIQIHLKPNAVKVMLEAYRELFKQELTLGCFKKKTNELVGLNVLGVKTRDEKSKETVGKLHGTQNTFDTSSCRLIPT